MSWPLKKSWKLRWRRARKVAGNPIPRRAEPFRAGCSELGGLGKDESFKAFLRDRLVALLYCRPRQSKTAVSWPSSRTSRWATFVVRPVGCRLAAPSFGLPQFGASQMQQEAVESERLQPRLPL